ncbi:MAG: NHL repeat-containing protein, partial [Thermoplasmataceae archaeon]
VMFQPNFTTAATATLAQGYTMEYDMAGFFYQVAIPNENIVSALPNPYQIYYGYPLYLAFDPDDNLWISDTQNHRIIQYLNSDILSNAYPYNCNTVLGQSQFYIHGDSNTNQYNFYIAHDLAFDKNNNLWVTDFRLAKGFKYPNYSQQIMQNYVVGGTFTGVGGLTQSGVSGANCISFDNFGNMYISDFTNNRIMCFDSSIIYNNNEPNAFAVIGQSNFTTGTATTTQNGLNIFPTSSEILSGKCVFDSSNNMYVSDTYNNRIMIFPFGSGFTTGMNASIVIGQTGFTTATSGSTASTLSYPVGLAFDNAGNLYVNDSGNSRVQKFVPPFTTGMSATISITGFGSDVVSGGLVFDKLGNLLVADSKNNRILGFPPSALNATTTTSSATFVLGQPNFTSVVVGLGQTALNQPTGLTINPQTGDLICCDAGNNRVVGWYYRHITTKTNKLDAKYLFYTD